MKKVFVITDVETVADARLVLDVAWHVCDSKGNILDSFNACVKDIFDASFGRMLVAKDGFTSRKLANGMRKSEWYLSSIDNGEMPVMSFADIKNAFNAISKTYNAKVVFCAYNAKFDYDALTTNANMYGLNGFFGNEVEFIDIMTMAMGTFCATKKYVKWAMNHNFVTEKGNIQTNAQAVYSYISNDTNFEERHTALADCDIEKNIFFKAYSYHKKGHKKFCMPVFNCDEWNYIQSLR